LSIIADVLIAEQVPAVEADHIEAEFAAIDVQPRLLFAAPKRSLGAIAWLVLAALPLQPFFNHLAEDVADDVHERLKTLVERVLHRTPTEKLPKPVLVLQDTNTGIQVVLEPDLPAESYRQLLSLDLAAIKQGPLHYDRYRGRWRSELDEAAE
jgi:hypothetical protein